MKDKDMDVVEQFNNKMHEFEQRNTEIKTDAFHLIFEYIDYLTLLEESWRRGCVTNILNYNLETRHSLIEEVRLICGLVYKDFIYPNIKNIKESFYKNPDFTSEISGFAGDSNFILGEDLYNLKTKHKSMPSEEDICQSVLYYLMSRCNKKYYKEVKGTFSKDNLINRLYIYNTRFGDKYEIKLNNMSDAYIENIMEEVYSMYNNFKLVKSGLLPY